MTPAPSRPARSDADPGPLFGGSPARARTTTLIAGLLLLTLIALDVAMGPAEVQVGLRDVGRVLAHRLWLDRQPMDPDLLAADSIVWEIRLPRTAVAVLIGALLAYAGVAFQGLLMNPLADPYTVGVSAGAAVGAALGEILGLSTVWLGFGRMGLAFVTAIGAVALVYALARVGGRVAVQTFLLAGVVVGTLLTAFIPLFLTLAHRANDLSRLLFYLIGSLTAADWPRAELLAPFLLLSAVCLRVWARELNLMALGEESAAHLGVDVERMKRRVLIVGSLSTAAAVSVGGIIGFVGLVVPHIARRFVGPDHRRLLAVSALLGAGLLVAADTVVRVYLNEMQVGVVTSLVGAPVFCYLLRRRRAVAW